MPSSEPLTVYSGMMRSASGTFSRIRVPTTRQMLQRLSLLPTRTSARALERAVA